MIGIYDSGLGGLTAFRELRSLCPDEDIVYLGDSARLPYGTKSKDTIIRYAMECGNYLVSLGIDSLLVACGTVSANALEEMKKSFSIPITGVIEPAVNTAIRQTKNGKIAVIATPASIRSRAYEKMIKSVNSEIEVYSKACPLFVPLVESGCGNDSPLVKLACEEYLPGIEKCEADTVILGCTHYPLISEAIQSYLPGRLLISAGKEAAAAVADKAKNGKGSTEFLVTDSVEGFRENAEYFLKGFSFCNVRKADIGN